MSLSLLGGECIVLTGPSGAGKTLLLRALADMDPADGEVRLDGVQRNELSGPEWRRQVGLLPAESHWWAERVGEHFAHAPSDDLSKLGFNVDVLNWQISRLSSGERQRLAIARLLTNRPRVLLLDEPTANLDPDNTSRVESLLKNYAQQCRAGMLWVSHDAEQAARVADRIFRIADGRLLLERKL
jgi:ABC-type iron transport system FetAB ATPase subunit